MKQYSKEQDFVAGEFRNGLLNYIKEPIVLYGIGKNTEAVLNRANDFNIVGLLDKDNENIGKVFYGKKVLELNEVTALAKKIVIIARATVTPIIYCRIREFVEKNNISVYDYSGKQLKSETDGYDSTMLDYWNYSFEDLKKCIEMYSAISFDIFDTLLGRYVLYPQDIFSLVEREALISGKSVRFKEKRIEAEKECGYAASLSDIYKCLKEKGFSDEECTWLKERELQWEEKIIYVRKKMLEALKYAKSLGKKVYLTSDMYLSKKFVEKILRLNGIYHYDGLLISCEEKAEKSDGALFRKLILLAKGKTLLHIGDNRYSDIDMAKQEGIDTWHIWSSYDIFAASSIHTLLADQKDDLGYRLALGMFCAKAFENPFALHVSKGKMVITQAEQVGYLFFGPWALSFMQWAEKQLEKNQIEQFLFQARDGFLFYHIAQIMQEYGFYEGIRLCYFKASRRAFITPSIQTKEDLKRGISRCPVSKRTKGDCLREWFHVEPNLDDYARYEQTESFEGEYEYLIKYFEQIRIEAEKERKNLYQYLKQKNLYNEFKAAIFDFVACGTVQLYLEKFLKKNMLGVYCATRDYDAEDVCNESNRIVSAFGTVSSYGGRSALSDIYMAVETILIDGDETLECFDENGNPVFQHRNSDNYNLALSIQDYACEFVVDYLKFYSSISISKEDSVQLLKMLFGNSCIIEKPILNAFKHDDVFGEGLTEKELVLHNRSNM